MSERRVESRFLCADLARLSWVDGEETRQPIEAVLEDISTVGACVQIEESMPLGAMVAISVDGARFTGYVTYCVYRDYGYFVGIHFTGHTSWSAGSWQPGHLTNLQQLAQAGGS